MAINARDLDGRARLVVEVAIAMRILAKVTIDAVHSFFKVDIV